MEGKKTLISIARTVLDAILPPLCLSCGAQVGEPGALCPDCWSKIAFLGDPCCACCGLPFEFDAGPEAKCGDCLQSPPRFARARAVLRYDDESRALILRLKHGDRLEGVPAFARWMARAGAASLAEADLLVPVPLHRWRLLSRRYNQAALLAMAIGRLSGVPCLPDALTRPRRTPPQGHMSREGRHRNVQGAFAVHPGRAKALAGKRVVLVDDVMTSGATLDECARILLKGGAARVEVLVLGRAIRVE